MMIQSLNRLITSKKIELVVKNFTTNKSTEPKDFTDGFYQTFKTELIPILRLLQKIEEGGSLPTHFMIARIILILKPYKDATRKENHRPSVS